MTKTVFGEEVDLMAETDGLYLQLIHILQRNDDFNAALEKGEMTEDAVAAISGAFDEVFDRNRRLANIFLADKEAREQITRFWFARSYAEVQANASYESAFRRALKAA